MTTIQTVLAVVMILASIFLTFTILMQSGSRQGMSGTISGGAETFFGSGKAKGMERHHLRRRGNLFRFRQGQGHGCNAQ